MYMRIVHINITPEKSREFTTFYEGTIIPELHKVPGCLCARLMQNDQNPDQFISMTLWENPEVADEYNQGLFQKLLADARPYLTDSTTWSLQLSEDFTLNYEPEPQDPTVSSFPVIAGINQTNAGKEEPDSMHMRVVSLKVQPGKAAEFRRIYTDEIIPALQKVRGCRYVYLTNSFSDENELFSITLWDSRQDAENYEKSGLFEQLKEKTMHTLSELYRWKMTLEKKSGKKMVTSDDMKVQYYSVITGNRLK